MLKKLRGKFILIAMSSVALVLLLIIGIINALNYHNVIENTDARIAMLRQTGAAEGGMPGELPGGPGREGASFAQEEAAGAEATGEEAAGAAAGGSETPAPAPPGPREEGEAGALFFFDRRNGLSEDSFFDSRFFIVTFSAEGEVESVNTGRISAVDEDSAAQLAKTAYGRNRKSGITGSYRFVRIAGEDGSVQYFFLDCSRELSTFSSFLTASCLMSAVGLLLVFLLVFFLSKWVMRPVAESYAKQKRFITDASHEIKTPLAVISAANEVIELENGESEWTKSIAAQISRLTDLTGKLVMLSRMDEESYRPAAAAFSLSETLGEVAESFTPVAQVKGKTYTVQIEDGISFSGDEQAIRQLASLLIDNAMKYAAGEGNIVVALKKSGKNKILSVENDAEGLAPGRHDELFERFYRADASRSSATGGHGIGLSVAKAITEAHGGKISAQSSDGKRIAFVCKF